jgi:hypothetical protein
VLLDFGLITDVDQDDQDSSSSVVGTVAYMAPEQARSKNVGPEVDWYAFGLILYEALVGTLPFEGTMTAILMKKQFIEPPRPVAVCPDVPEDLDSLCMSLLQIDPQKRPSERNILAQLGASQDELDLAKISAPSYSTFSSPFVGRHKELAWLQTALEQMEGGQQISVFVQGASGVGKSELVRRFTTRVRQENPEVVVLSGRCYERESVPYNAFDGIADALSRYMMQLPRDEASRLLPRRADLLPQLFPVLRRVEVIAREPYQDHSKVEPQELRKRMFNAFRELLVVLGEHHPLILFIDDFQWASADSLMLFEELLHPPDPPRLLLVATERTSALMQGRSRELRGAGKLAGAARYLWLDRFPPETSRELVTLLLSKLPGDREALIDKIAEEAEGHPMFIQELVRHLESGGAETTGAMRLDDALPCRSGSTQGAARPSGHRPGTGRDSGHRSPRAGDALQGSRRFRSRRPPCSRRGTARQRCSGFRPGRRVLPRRASAGPPRRGRFPSAPAGPGRGAGQRRAWRRGGRGFSGSLQGE